MRSTHKNSVWAGIWNRQHLWMLCIWRTDFNATLRYSTLHRSDLVNNFAWSQRSLKVCINASKRLLTLLPLIFGRRFAVSVSRDPLSLFSLIAQLAFHGPLWQLQPFWKAEYSSPPLSARHWGGGGLRQGHRAAECQCQKWPFSWKSGAGVRHCPCKKERCGFSFFSSPFLGYYTWTDEFWLPHAPQVPDPSSGLISTSPPSPTLLRHRHFVMSN